MKLIGVIDPGHGGGDPGCIGSNSVEKALTLKYALELEQELASRGHLITLTRRRDEYLSLQKRAQIANTLSRKADFFVSLHFDWNQNPAVKGTWAFYHNAITYLQDGRIKESPSRLGKSLADCIVQNVVRTAGTNNRGIAPRPMYKNGKRVEGQLYVLRHTLPWASLIEICFLSNPDDEANALKDDFRQKVVFGLANGIEEWGRMCLNV